MSRTVGRWSGARKGTETTGRLEIATTSRGDYFFEHLLALFLVLILSLIRSLHLSRVAVTERVLPGNPPPLSAHETNA